MVDFFLLSQTKKAGLCTSKPMTISIPSFTQNLIPAALTSNLFSLQPSTSEILSNHPLNPLILASGFYGLSNADSLLNPEFVFTNFEACEIF